jgi:SRSO17 transposase
LFVLTNLVFLHLKTVHDLLKRQTAPVEVREARPLKTRGDLARRLRDAKLTKPALALKMLKAALAQGIAAGYLLADAWFTSPKFCQGVRDLGLQVSGRLQRVDSTASR